MVEIELIVKGMHCASCEMLIKDILEDEGGVKFCEASKDNNSVKVKFDESKIKLEKIKSLIKEEKFEVK